MSRNTCDMCGLHSEEEVNDIREYSLYATEIYHDCDVWSVCKRCAGYLNLLGRLHKETVLEMIKVKKNKETTE